LALKNLLLWPVYDRNNGAVEDFIKEALWYDQSSNFNKIIGKTILKKAFHILQDDEKCSNFQALENYIIYMHSLILPTFFMFSLNIKKNLLTTKRWLWFFYVSPDDLVK
jgi:hypothetical protein